MHGGTSWQEILNGLFMRAGFPSVAHYVQPCLLGIVSAELDGTVSMPPPPSPCAVSICIPPCMCSGEALSELLPFFGIVRAAEERRDLRDCMNVAPKEALFDVAKLNEIRMLSGASGSIAEVAPSHRRYNYIIINNLQDWWPGRELN